MSLFPLRINLGGSIDCRTDEGPLWAADHREAPETSDPSLQLQTGDWRTYAASSAPRAEVIDLQPVEYAELIRTELVDVRRIQIGVPAGIYTLTLVVAETCEILSKFDRRFRVGVNGQWIEEPISPYAIAGGYARAGLVKIEGVKVDADGQLRLDFDGKVFNYNAILSGLQLESGSETATPLQLQTRALAPCHLAEPPRAPRTRTVHLLAAGHSGVFFWDLPATLQRMLAWSHPELELIISN